MVDTPCGGVTIGEAKEVVELVVTLGAGGRPTLAGQFLALQLAVLLLALAVTSVVSVRQSDADFRDTRGARLRAAAEDLASTPAVRTSLGRSSPPPASLASYAQQRAATYRASASTSPDPDGTVARRHATPPAVGEPIDLGDSDVAASGARGPATSTTAAPLDRRPGAGDRQRRASSSAS